MTNSHFIVYADYTTKMTVSQYLNKLKMTIGHIFGDLHKTIK